MSSSAQSSPSISRPRPVSLMSRPVRRSTGSAPQELQRTLAAAVRKISTSSLPSITNLQNCPSPASEGGKSPATPPTGSHQGHKPEFRAIDPVPCSPSHGHSVHTAPFLPIFSAISVEPLQPQQLVSKAGKQSTGSVSTPNHTPSASLTDSGEFGADRYGDKYAALADLDSVFSDPTKTPSTATSINWSGAPATEQESQEDASLHLVSTSGGSAAQGQPSSERVTHSSARRSGLVTVAGGPFNGGTAFQSEAGHSQAISSPNLPRTATGTAPQAPSTLMEAAVDPSDKYAALANLTDTALGMQVTAIDWGTASPQDTLEAGAQTNTTVAASTAAGVLSSSPPSGSVKGAAPVTTDGAPCGLGPATHGTLMTVQSQPAYCAPSYVYSPAPMAHLGFAPTSVVGSAGYAYPPHPTGHPFPPAVPAYAQTTPQGFVAQGALWGQASSPVPHRAAPSSNTFVMGSQPASHTPLCHS